MKGPQSVLIVGGGWAGMAAALELDHHDIPVTLLESASRPGGRARSVEQLNECFDNGQHLLIGAYHETLRQLSRLGFEETEVLERRPLKLEVLDADRPLTLHAPPLPAPLHLAWALLRARGLDYSEKLRALNMSLQLARSGYQLPNDISVAALLAQYRQGESITRRFWEPLCLATLNTPLDKASASVFLRVLKDSFSHRRSDSDLLIPKVPLGTLFAETAAKQLARKPSNQILPCTRVSALDQENGRISSAQTADLSWRAGDIILATSPAAAARLLKPLPGCTPVADAIASLGSQPITTVYLHYPETPPLPSPMLGLSGTTAQWVFDRRVCQQPGWLAVVVSANGPHNDWDKETLSRHIQAELASLLPGWPESAEQSLVIREKRATFECRVGINTLRPDNLTPIDGLWLAGDYTATGYPGTLEGAVRSGVQCARRIIAQRNNTT